MQLAGKKYSELKSDTIQNFKCPKCSSSNTTKISVFGSYKHLLQIPFIAKNNIGKSNCSSCNTNYDLDSMPDAIKLAYYELKETTRTPIWYYAGFIVIKTLVLIKIFSKYV